MKPPLVLADLEFENEKLVKLRGMRHNYMDGDRMIQVIGELGSIILDLQRQLYKLEEVKDTVEEYRSMPCRSLEVRMFQTLERYFPEANKGEVK